MREVPQKELIREYRELWYDDPQNFKQPPSNNMVLKMCASARWRFPTKIALGQWARHKRDARWNSLLAFSSPEEVEGETYYFKSLCLESQVNDLKATVKDIVRFRIPMDIPESQLGHAMQFKSELQTILHAAIAAADVRVE